MTYSKTDFLRLIHDTKAVSIWNRNKGPVFWYAASVPGPFYVNTEFVIGGDLSAHLLEKITALLAATKDPAARAKQIDTLVMGAFEENESFKRIIETLVAKAREEFPTGAFSVISGGERRDWLFSIPFAKLYGIKHAYIFKNHDVYCEEGFTAGEPTLHVSDLINNAASYFDAWFPALQKVKLPCIGTVCVNSRGSNGVTRLKEAGQKVVALNSIDIDFFEESFKNHIIDEGTLEELKIYFKSSSDWASKYLVNDLSHLPLFDIEHLDPKSMERLRNFFTQDPWKLEATHKVFFDEMKKAAK